MVFSGVALGQLEGRFEKIGDLPARNSQDVVVMEEFLNFTCPHCNNFRSLAKPVLKKYGKRLRVINRPILFRGQTDPALRLYFIAEKAGRGMEVKDIIFEATFTYGFNIYDPRVVNLLARTAGLWEQYQQEAQASWVTEKINLARRRADLVGVTGTPTLVLGNALRLTPDTGMQIFINNLDRLIAQILRNEG